MCHGMQLYYDRTFPPAPSSRASAACPRANMYAWPCKYGILQRRASDRPPPPQPCTFRADTQPPHLGPNTRVLACRYASLKREEEESALRSCTFRPATQQLPGQRSGMARSRSVGPGARGQAGASARLYQQALDQARGLEAKRLQEQQVGSFIWVLPAGPGSSCWMLAWVHLACTSSAPCMASRWTPACRGCAKGQRVPIKVGLPRAMT